MGKFYKKENENWFEAVEIIFPTGEILNAENEEDKTKSLYGWNYYENPPQEYIDFMNELNNSNFEFPKN